MQKVSLAVPFARAILNVSALGSGVLLRAPPLLQTLSLNSYSSVNFMPIVHRYGQSLTGLNITIRRDTLFGLPCILPLPRLENLTFNDFGKEKSSITMITPRPKVLVTTVNYDCASFPLEMDLGLLYSLMYKRKASKYRRFWSFLASKFFISPWIRLATVTSSNLSSTTPPYADSLQLSNFGSGTCQIQTIWNFRGHFHRSMDNGQII
jgi:ABC-type sugar transport system permease subunit